MTNSRLVNIDRLFSILKADITALKKSEKKDSLNLVELVQRDIVQLNGAIEDYKGYLEYEDRETNE